MHNNNDVWKDLESKLNIQDSSFSISMTLTQMEEHFQKFSVIIQELQTFFVRYVQHVDEAFSTLNWLRHKEIEYLNNEIIKSRSEHDKISEGLGVRINELQFELQKETEMRLAIEAVLDNSMLNFSDSDFHDEKQKWKRMASMWEVKSF